MTRPYVDLPLLSTILLEESYVLDIEARPASIRFRVDFALTPEHPEYVRPSANEVHCTRRGWMRFSGVTTTSWSGQGVPPARDATGEVDYGNIDSFTFDGSTYTLEGDWGHLVVVADRISVDFG